MSQIKQSICWWCFTQVGMTPQQLLRTAADIGYAAVELVEPEHWPLVKAYGLSIASINGELSIEQGLNRRERHQALEQQIRTAIFQAEQHNIPNVIVFSGNRAQLSDQEGAEATAEGLSHVAKVAEEAGVTLVIELLNSKVDHQDYQCDHTAWGVEVCRMVDSPRVKLLYDIYHMQIMEGDLIHTIREHHQWIAHYHLAGNPGRHEPDEAQEIYYPPVLKAIAETGFTGYIGHEYVPLGNPVAALKASFALSNFS